MIKNFYIHKVDVQTNQQLNDQQLMVQTKNQNMTNFPGWNQTTNSNLEEETGSLIMEQLNEGINSDITDEGPKEPVHVPKEYLERFHNGSSVLVCKVRPPSLHQITKMIQ